MTVPFRYVRAPDESAAIAAVRQSGATAIAGGTLLVDLLRLGVMAPSQVVDLNALPLDRIEEVQGAISIGALARNSDTAFHPLVRSRLPGLSEALLSGASPQLRNMATAGGNIMQRTRCSYFRDVGVPACNKRLPGSGCAALDGYNRMHAILGGSPHCIAVHPSDMCVALVALDAVIHTRGGSRDERRTLPIADFHVLPVDRPDLETVLEPGELITHVTIPLTPLAARSRYVKVRDRASYAFALASAAVALELDGDRIRAARVALGGVATKPWRSPEGEQALVGRAATRATFEEAAREALAAAAPRSYNGFKIPLARATIVRALERAKENT
jgi:xanthine dehydrogenase YagS FAD-binding subunit